MVTESLFCSSCRAFTHVHSIFSLYNVDALAASMILQRPPPIDIERKAHGKPVFARITKSSCVI